MVTLVRQRQELPNHDTLWPKHTGFAEGGLHFLKVFRHRKYTHQSLLKIGSWRGGPGPKTSPENKLQSYYIVYSAQALHLVLSEALQTFSECSFLPVAYWMDRLALEAELHTFCEPGLTILATLHIQCPRISSGLSACRLMRALRVFLDQFLPLENRNE